MVNLTIDGRQISVEENTTIMEAARSVGIQIPSLCYLKGINEIGACRVCVVELEGKDRLITACNNICEEGMVIYTNSLAVFQRDGCGGNLHDTGVEQHTIFLADDMQHGRGDETPVALAKDTDNGIIDGVIVMGVHAQRTQQRLQDIIIDLVIVVAHADVARGQSNQMRQMDQRTRETLRTFCTLCHIP